MIKHSLILIFLCAVFLAASFATNRAKTLTAITTADNDLAIAEHPKGIKVEIPSAVLNVIDSIVHTDFKHRQTTIDSAQSRQLSIDTFYGPVFRITTPGNQYLFVFKEEDVGGIILYYLIMYDPKSRQATTNPPWIYGKWMEGGEWGAELTRPLVSFDTSDGMKTRKLIFEERVHNGTEYNAIVYHYFEISTDLSLRHVLALETRQSDLFTEQEGGIVERTIKKISQDSLLIDTFLEIPGCENLDLGQTLIVRESAALPYHIAKKIIKNDKYRDLLITGIHTEADENKFLNEGDTFDY